jgi:hypothetical protein
MKRSILLSTFLFAAVLAPILLQSNECSIDSYPKLARLELYVPDISGQNMISGFRPDGILYEVELSLDPPDTAVLVVEAQYATSTIEVTYDSLPISLGPNGVAPLTLEPNHSEIKVAVMADNKVWTYTVSIDRVDYCPCDDGNVCTYDFCNQATQVCEYPPVPDGSICANLKGECHGGLCNYVPVTVTVGAREIVYDWTTDRCEDLNRPELLDIPDAPARVVRAEDGELVLFSGNSWVSRGSSFNALQRVCDPPAFVTVFGDAPESYENQEWPWSPYREGAVWHLLIHNEFHDAVAPTCDVGNPFAGNPCWYNSITYAVSTDNASTFTKPSPPAHVVAPAPNVWVPPPSPGTPATEGYFNPTNIVRGPDDFYYTLFMAIPVQSGQGGACAMRTQTLNESASWRAWDGTGFNLPLESPYVTGTPTDACGFLPQNLDYILPPNTGSLIYNTYIERYMLVFEAETIHGCGVHASTSSDLVHWGELQFLIRAHFGHCSLDPNVPGNLEPVAIQYPSIIDHADSTTNFERTGRTPYLYYTRHNGGLDRDLVRVPLTFTVEE